MLLHVGQNMRVQVKSDADVGMTQPLRHDLRVDSSRQLQGRVGVAQAVQRQVRQATGLNEACELAGYLGWNERETANPSEDVRATGSWEPSQTLKPPNFVQESDGFRSQSHVSAGAFCLGQPFDQPTTIYEVKCTYNTKTAFSKVNGIPFQTAYLAPTKASMDGKAEQLAVDALPVIAEV